MFIIIAGLVNMIGSFKNNHPNGKGHCLPVSIIFYKSIEDNLFYRQFIFGLLFMNKSKHWQNQQSW